MQKFQAEKGISIGTPGLNRRKEQASYYGFLRLSWCERSDFLPSYKSAFFFFFPDFFLAAVETSPGLSA